MSKHFNWEYTLPTMLWKSISKYHPLTFLFKCTCMYACMRAHTHTHTHTSRRKMSEHQLHLHCCLLTTDFCTSNCLHSIKKITFTVKIALQNKMLLSGQNTIPSGTNAASMPQPVWSFQNLNAEIYFCHELHKTWSDFVQKGKLTGSRASSSKS